MFPLPLCTSSSSVSVSPRLPLLTQYILSSFSSHQLSSNHSTHSLLFSIVPPSPSHFAFRAFSSSSSSRFSSTPLASSVPSPSSNPSHININAKSISLHAMNDTEATDEFDDEDEDDNNEFDDADEDEIEEEEEDEGEEGEDEDEDEELSPKNKENNIQNNVFKARSRNPPSLSNDNDENDTESDMTSYPLSHPRHPATISNLQKSFPPTQALSLPSSPSSPSFSFFLHRYLLSHLHTNNSTQHQIKGMRIIEGIGEIVIKRITEYLKIAQGRYDMIQKSKSGKYDENTPTTDYRDEANLLSQFLSEISFSSSDDGTAPSSSISPSSVHHFANDLITIKYIKISRDVKYATIYWIPTHMDEFIVKENALPPAYPKFPSAILSPSYLYINNNKSSSSSSPSSSSFPSTIPSPSFHRLIKIQIVLNKLIKSIQYQMGEEMANREWRLKYVPLIRFVIFDEDMEKKQWKVVENMKWNREKEEGKHKEREKNMRSQVEENHNMMRQMLKRNHHVKEISKDDDNLLVSVPPSSSSLAASRSSSRPLPLPPLISSQQYSSLLSFDSPLNFDRVSHRSRERSKQNYERAQKKRIEKLKELKHIYQQKVNEERKMSELQQKNIKTENVKHLFHYQTTTSNNKQIPFSDLIGRIKKLEFDIVSKAKEMGYQMGNPLNERGEEEDEMENKSLGQLMADKLYRGKGKQDNTDRSNNNNNTRGQDNSTNFNSFHSNNYPIRLSRAPKKSTSSSPLPPPPSRRVISTANFIDSYTVSRDFKYSRKVKKYNVLSSEGGRGGRERLKTLINGGDRDERGRRGDGSANGRGRERRKAVMTAEDILRNRKAKQM